MSFAEDYAKFTTPSPEREAFVLHAITSLPKEAIVNSMKTITVNRPDGSTLSYKVMPDYITVDGVRVPMSGSTAQQVASYFGLSLPTAQMAQDIYNHSDVKVAAEPLSASGTTIDGTYYSGSDVVKNKGVGYAPFAIAYNDKINKQLAEHGAQPGGDQIVSGFAKDIVNSPNPNTLGLYGMYDAKGRAIQGGVGETPHDKSIHTEYGSFARLVSPDVTITYPDGRTETKSVNDVYSLGSAPSATKPPDSAPQSSPANRPPPGAPTDPALQSLDKALQEFSSAAKTRMKLLEKVAKFSKGN